MSPTPDGALDDPQRIIAYLQLQLPAERTADRDAALVREGAAAEILGVINSSPRASESCTRRSSLSLCKARYRTSLISIQLQGQESD